MNLQFCQEFICIVILNFSKEGTRLMTEFFYYNNTPEIIQKNLTRAELDIYTEIKKLSKAVKNSTVFATIDYLIKHSQFRSKGSVSNALNGLINKGLLVRELVQSNKSRHKCYQYYIVYDLTLTKLYQDLTEEEKKKYVVSVKADAEPYTALTEEQNRLYIYLKYTAGIKDMTHKKLLILLETAKNNADIVSGTEINTILLMSKYCMDSRVINKFGYLKKTIANYSTGTTASYIPQDKPTDSETFTGEQERLYSACNEMNVRLSTKQIKAIVSVADKLRIDIGKVIGIISDVVHVKGIKDIFRYIIKSVYNHSKKYSDSVHRAEQSYDLEKFEDLAITFSGNTKGRMIFGTEPQEQKPDQTTAPDAEEQKKDAEIVTEHKHITDAEVRAFIESLGKLD